MLDGKVFRLGKFARLHADGLQQNDVALHDKYRFPVSSLHVHVDRGVVVAVEEESESVSRENCRHGDGFLRGQRGQRGERGWRWERGLVNGGGGWNAFPMTPAGVPDLSRWREPPVTAP